MAIPVSPEETILEGLVAVAEAAEIATIFEVPEFNVRHQRNRYSLTTERPCVAFRLINVSLDPDRQQIHDQEEVCWIMEVDAVFDLKLATEDSGDDPTGWGVLTAMARYLIGKICDPDGTFRLTIADDAMPGDVDPSEDSTPDNGRLAHGIRVLYRTAWRDPNLLLQP